MSSFHMKWRDRCHASRRNGQVSVVNRAATQEVVNKTDGPVLVKRYYGPHVVPEEGIERITDMLRKGDMFRYGGNDEGSLQVRVYGLNVNQNTNGRIFGITVCRLKHVAVYMTVQYLVFMI